MKRPFPTENENYRVSRTSAGKVIGHLPAGHFPGSLIQNSKPA